MFENEDSPWDFVSESFSLNSPNAATSKQLNFSSNQNVNPPLILSTRSSKVIGHGRDDAENEGSPDCFLRTSKRAKGDDEPFQPNPSGILPPALKTAVDKRKQKFPGPAGVVGKMVSSNEPQKNMFLQSAQLSEPTTQTQQDSILTQLTHHNSVWSHMLKSEECASTSDSPSLLATYNIAWAKQKLSSTEFLFKMPLLAGTVNALDVSFGMDPRGELIDPSGMTSCIFHRDFVERHGSLLLLSGTVLVLQNVTVVKMSNGKMSVTVTTNNLVAIYYSRGQRELCEKLICLSKDEVRRNAARLNREEKTLSRMLEQETSNSHSSSSTSQFNPGMTSSPMALLPLQHSTLQNRPTSSITNSAVRNQFSNMPPKIQPSSSFRFGIPKSGPCLASSSGVGNRPVSNMEVPTVDKDRHQMPVRNTNYPNQIPSLFSDDQEASLIGNLLEGLDEESIFGDF